MLPEYAFRGGLLSVSTSAPVFADETTPPFAMTGRALNQRQRFEMWTCFCAREARSVIRQRESRHSPLRTITTFFGIGHRRAAVVSAASQATSQHLAPLPASRAYPSPRCRRFDVGTHLTQCWVARLSHHYRHRRFTRMTSSSAPPASAGPRLRPLNIGHFTSTTGRGRERAFVLQ